MITRKTVSSLEVIRGNFGRKAMTNLDGILKSRDITLPTKVHIIKAIVFPVVMYGPKEGWVLKNWCFWTVMLEKTLESLLDSRRSNQSILKGINPRYSWKDWCRSWSSSTLATWWEELTHWKRPWWWKRLRAGGKGDDRGWDGWMASLTQQTWVWANSRRWWRTGKPGGLQSTGLQKLDMTKWLRTYPQI